MARDQEDCACFVDALEELRANALRQSFGLIADAASVGVERPSRSVVVRGCLAVLQYALDDCFEEHERVLLRVHLTRFSKTLTELEMLEGADGVGSHGH
jgi:hypothetical protein